MLFIDDLFLFHFVFSHQILFCQRLYVIKNTSFIGFRKQVAGRACREKCGDLAKKFMEKCKLYLDFSVDLCYDNTIENYGRMKNAPT